MKCLFALCAAVVFGGVAFAGEVGPVSQAPCVDCVPQQNIVVLESRPARPIVIVERAPRRTCVSGRCNVSTADTCANGTCAQPQQYSVQENASETVRRRPFGGGYVIRNNSRAVVKPVR